MRNSCPSRQCRRCHVGGHLKGLMSRRQEDRRWWRYQIHQTKTCKPQLVAACPFYFLWEIPAFLVFIIVLAVGLFIEIIMIIIIENNKHPVIDKKPASGQCWGQLVSVQHCVKLRYIKHKHLHFEAHEWISKQTLSSAKTNTHGYITESGVNF